MSTYNVEPSHSGDHYRGGSGELGRTGVERASFTKLVSTSFHLSPRKSKARGSADCSTLYARRIYESTYKGGEGTVTMYQCFDVISSATSDVLSFTQTHAQSFFRLLPRVSGRPSPIPFSKHPGHRPPVSYFGTSTPCVTTKMKAVVILSALFAAALAAPSPDAVARSLARRKAARAQRAAQHSTPRILAAAADQYDENWAGAVLTGESVTAASGSFPVLKAAVPTEKETGEKEYTASAWIGLDGYNCDGLWQAGVDSIVESSGETSFYAWYEW